MEKVVCSSYVLSLDKMLLIQLFWTRLFSALPLEPWQPDNHQYSQSSVPHGFGICAVEHWGCTSSSHGTSARYSCCTGHWSHYRHNLFLCTGTPIMVTTLRSVTSAPLEGGTSPLSNSTWETLLSVVWTLTKTGTLEPGATQRYKHLSADCNQNNRLI